MPIPGRQEADSRQMLVCTRDESKAYLLNERAFVLAMAARKLNPC